MLAVSSVIGNSFLFCKAMEMHVIYCKIFFSLMSFLLCYGWMTCDFTYFQQYFSHIFWLGCIAHLGRVSDS